MDDIQQKEEFEVWAVSKGFNLTKSHDGTYVYRPAFYAFMGWSESRRVHIEERQAVQIDTLDMSDI